MSNDKSRKNIHRLQFMRAFYRTINPTTDPKILFEALNETFSEVYGRQVYKDYNAFRFSRAHYIKTGRMHGGQAHTIRKPEADETCVICPGCLSKLVFK